MRLVDYQRPIGHLCPSRAIASVHLDVVPWLSMTVFKQLNQAPITSVGEDSMGFPCAASVPFSTVTDDLEAFPVSLPLCCRSASPFLRKLAAVCPGRQKSS